MKLRDFVLATSAAVGIIFLGGSWLAIDQAFEASFREQARQQAETMAQVTFAAMFEVMSQGWTRTQAERFLAKTHDVGDERGLRVAIYRGAAVEESHGVIEQPVPGADVRVALERGERRDSFHEGSFRSTFPLKAEAQCTRCHTNVSEGEVLGAIEILQPSGSLLQKARLQYYASAAPSLILGLLLAIGSVWWVSRRIAGSVSGVEARLESINKLSDLRHLAAPEDAGQFSEIRRIHRAIAALASRLRAIAVDKDILMFEIGLLEKCVITSETIRDWRVYVGQLLHDINGLIDAHVLFSVFQIDDDLFDIEIFWHRRADEDSRARMEAAIRGVFEHHKRASVPAKVNIHHHSPHADAAPFALCQDELTPRVKSLFVGQPKIGGIVGIGVYPDALVDHTRQLVLDTILSTLLNVVGSIKAIHQYTRDLEYYATRDPLTDLYNQRVFWEMLGYEIGRSQRHRFRATLLVIDLDNFKLINDHYGHAAGDRFLQLFAGAVKDALRGGDILARYGGDEFVVVLPETGLEQGYVVAQRVLDAARQVFLTAPDGGRVHASASIGLAVYPDHAGDAKDMFLFADNMMYRAKSEGKERIALPTDEDVMAVFRDVSEIGVAVLAAVNERRVIPFFQPIAAVRETGRLAAVEVLSRLEINGELLCADQFIEIAEKMGIIHRLDASVIEAALERVRTTDFDGYIFFNLSPRALVLPEFFHTLCTVVHASGIAPDRIVFEITERDTVKNLTLLERFFADLKAEGFRLAIDDFGSGFSSFHYLRRFPFDFLKIEGDFIANMLHSQRDRIFVRSITELARALDIRVVAEFVESAEVLQMIDALGIDFAQGHHIGRPDRSIRAAIASALDAASP